MELNLCSAKAHKDQSLKRCDQLTKCLKLAIQEPLVAALCRALLFRQKPHELGYAQNLHHLELSRRVQYFLRQYYRYRPFCRPPYFGIHTHTNSEVIWFYRDVDCLPRLVLFLIAFARFASADFAAFYLEIWGSFCGFESFDRWMTIHAASELQAQVATA